MEQFFPEGRRLIVFKVIFGSLFIILVTFLGYRQLIQWEKYKEQERKQGQRRIVRPGPRGDVFDRNGNLLIGNKAHFSAKLHLESIEDEIWKKKSPQGQLGFIANGLKKRKSTFDRKTTEFWIQ